jgi:hypothetical protein
MPRYGSTWVSGISLRQAALIAGLAYLFNPVTFAEIYAMPRLVVGEPGQTVRNFVAHPHLFAAAILCYSFSVLGDTVLAWSLYILLAPVNRAVSLLAAWLQITYAAITMAAISNLGVVYRILLIPSYSVQVSGSPMAMPVTTLLAGFRSGWGLALILFGLHLVVLGWLVARSSYIPTWLGWMLFLNGCAYVADSLSIYVMPDANVGYLTAFFFFELIFMVWLLGWGWRIKEPSEAE